MRGAAIWLLVGVLGLLSACQRAATPTPRGEMGEVTIAPLTIINAQGSRITLEVEIVDTLPEMVKGLQGRLSLPPNRGMLFDFFTMGESVTIPFYMKDTYIPLSIAFISSGGEIIDIQDMEPLTEDLHHSAAPYRYALEVNQGFFRKNAIGIGSRVQWQ